MKILETQAAHLTNHEVLQHLDTLRDRCAEATERRSAPVTSRSGNLETIMRELAEYMRTSPSPLSPPTSYNASTIRELFTALREFDLTKAEFLMILNLRPQSIGVLDTIIEEMESRLDDVEQENILTIIEEVLGGNGPQTAADEIGEDATPTAKEMDGVVVTNGHPRHI